jgi:hypothetical protein
MVNNLAAAPPQSKLGKSTISRPAHGFIQPPAQPGEIPTTAIPPNCGEDPRILGSGPQMYFATVAGQAVGGALGDIYVQLPFPCRVFFLNSVLTPQNSVFFHLEPLGKTASYGGSNAIIAKGNEQWFPMTNQAIATAAPFFWSILKFKRPIQAFYLDLGNENGAANLVTICCVKDEEEFVVDGGPWSG